MSWYVWVIVVLTIIYTWVWALCVMAADLDRTAANAHKAGDHDEDSGALIIMPNNTLPEEVHPSYTSCKATNGKGSSRTHG